MPARTIALIAAGIFVLTAALVTVLWWAGTAGLSGRDLIAARFDALRTGSTIGLGSGGLFALYLAWRRQHATEVALVHKERDQADVARAYELQREVAEHNRLHAERVAAATEKDAADRQVTELYTKASEQLGSDKAPVRLAGLYALERLAQDNPDHRQTVVNVLCAYLRMPYTMPGFPPADDATRDRYTERVQEREVRLTAQNILTYHLNPGPSHQAKTYWPQTDLNLTNATLIDFNIANCRPHRSEFVGATFIGDAVFIGATFTGDAVFHMATFTSNSWFHETTFTGNAVFRMATFTGEAKFGKAIFTRDAAFRMATFTGDAMFHLATFTGNVAFNNVTFTGDFMLHGAIARHLAMTTWPTGWEITDDHQPIDGREGTWHRLAKVEAVPTDSP
ncbi:MULTISPECIES: pentapeptide repeat-containing protein [Actinosynnema]|uniref:pentapeptide repeat-containing protein n=1 Tax=Actinosynnema TaxID=40566 RepID=UPI0020A33A93|nr:pentapeptide repeat-containing protein [Actinosynnema pretiosum]MCP2098095.1 Pentapeptide repeat-containing protein [Actinosynnema pretiosum]